MPLVIISSSLRLGLFGPCDQLMHGRRGLCCAKKKEKEKVKTTKRESILTYDKPRQTQNAFVQRMILISAQLKPACALQLHSGNVRFFWNVGSLNKLCPSVDLRCLPTRFKITGSLGKQQQLRRLISETFALTDVRPAKEVTSDLWFWIQKRSEEM